MIVSSSMQLKSKHRGPKLRFLVYLLKISRLPSYVPKQDTDLSALINARKDALKVTALYNGKQLSVGEFRVTMNECIIDQKMICQLYLPDVDAQSKLHLYIDEAYSSGLIGHLALDLKEFVREDETEIYVKYPLYANTSGLIGGPVLKMIVRSLGKCVGDVCSDDDGEIYIFQQKSTDQSGANGKIDLAEKLQADNLDQARLLQLEDALSDIGEKLKTLMSACKSSGECSEIGNCLSGEVESPSTLTSPMLSSIHTGTSTDSSSEQYDDQCTVADDVLDPYMDMNNSLSSLPSSKQYLRTMSDLSTQRCTQVVNHHRNMSTDDGWSEFSYQGRRSDPRNDSSEDCQDDCFMCSSAYALKSYRGIHDSLLRSNSQYSSKLNIENIKSSPERLKLMPKLTAQEVCTASVVEETPVVRKGPGLLKSLFGAVVIAGVSFLGVRNSSQTRDRYNSRSNVRPGNNGSRSGRFLRSRYH